MKVLFVLPEFPPQYGGGIATCYDVLVPAVAAMGHEVDVLVGSAFTEHRPRRTEDGYSVEFLDVDRRRQAFEKFTSYEAMPSLRRTLAAAWALFQQSDRGKGYDVVETTDFGLLFLPWVTSECTPPVLVQLHASNGQIDGHEPKKGKTLQGHLTRLLELQGLPHAEGLQSSGRPNAQEWRNRLGCDVWYSPPPLRQRDPPASEIPSDEFDADGFVAGRIQYWKGPTVLCEAQAHLGKKAPRIDWAGRDTDYCTMGSSMCEYLYDTYPQVWGENIRPIGEITPKEVIKRQATAQFVVVPSIWDVFNYTAVEAMQVGGVVICSEGAGAADLIEHGENGFVFPAEDALALSKLLATASHLSKKKRRAITCAAQETVQQRLAPRVIAKDREDVYRKIQGDGTHTSAPFWLAEAVTPNGKFEMPARPMAFLDELPLREIGRYAVQRVWKKLMSSE